MTNPSEPARLSTRPWVGLVAMVAALGLFLPAYLSSLSANAAVALGRQLPGSVAGQTHPRALSHNFTTATLRTTDRFRAYRDGLNVGVRPVYVMGSSELSSLAPQNPANWVSTGVSDVDLYLSGRGYVQSLPHAIELAAVEPWLNERKVVLIVSPQWFTPSGITPEAFAEVSSSSLLTGAMGNPHLSDETKASLWSRVAELAPASASPDSARAEVKLEPTAILERFEERLASRPTELLESLKAGRDLPDLSGGAGAAGVTHDSIAWTAMLTKAEEDGRLSISNNPYGIEDRYFDKYVRDRLGELAGSQAHLDYAEPSPEYGDLELFLQVAKDLGIEVQLVSVPMNGPWYDYTGYPAQRRTVYYEKIRTVASHWGAHLADFSGDEYTPYFLYDIMHLGWKGWLDVTRSCIDFGFAS